MRALKWFLVFLLILSALMLVGVWYFLRMIFGYTVGDLIPVPEEDMTNETEMYAPEAQ